MKYGRAKGSARYKCADCNATQFETAYTMNLRNRPRCKGCGGTFLEPDTDAGDKHSIAAGTARAILDHVPPQTGRENMAMRGERDLAP